MKIQFKLKNGTLTLKEAIEILNDYLAVRAGKVTAVHASDGTVMMGRREFSRQISNTMIETGEKLKAVAEKRASRGKPKVRRVK